jgi:methyl-accepting chemotaxis protein
MTNQREPVAQGGRLEALGGGFTVAVGAILLLIVLAAMGLNYAALQREHAAQQRALLALDADQGLDALVRSVQEGFISEGSSSAVANAGARAAQFAAATRMLPADLLPDAQRRAAAEVHAATQTFLSDPDAMRIDNVESMVALGRWLAQAAELSRALGQTARAERAVADRAALQAQLANLATGVLVVATVAGIFLMFFVRVTRPLLRAIRFTRQVSEGDLTQELPARGAGLAAPLFDSLTTMNAALRRIVGHVRTGTETVAEAAGEINDWNADLMARAEEHATTLEEIAASVERLADLVRLNTRRAREASALVDTASRQAEDGRKVVGGSVDVMQRIARSSDRISEIITVIDGIAFQTNILALNAAVEAARAGEHGRGFAVVASEVRSLAQRTAAAAKDVKALIAESVADAQAGAREAGRIGELIGVIAQSFGQFTERVAEIASASSDQGTGIDEINSALRQMNEGAQSHAAFVERARGASDALAGQARGLLDVVMRFRVDEQPGAAKLAAPG